MNTPYIFAGDISETVTEKDTKKVPGKCLSVGWYTKYACQWGGRPMGKQNCTPSQQYIIHVQAYLFFACKMYLLVPNNISILSGYYVW